MDTLPTAASEHLNALTAFPDRHVGSEGNRAATSYFAERVGREGLIVSRHRFDCLEWDYGSAHIGCAGTFYRLHVGPYSPPATLSAVLVEASTVEQLERDENEGTILLLHGEIASHQLMPKNFPFYNPESHRRIHRALETHPPAALVAATGVDPEMVGSQYPFPLFEDGDLEIPSAYTTEIDGERLLGWVGSVVDLEVESKRIPTFAEQVVATKPGSGDGRFIVCAHIDSRKDSPGALDNACGVAVLLRLASLLDDYEGEPSIELVPFNGEDNYAAPGQQLWLALNEGALDEIVLGVNIDDAGFVGWDTHLSFYGCPDGLRAAALQTARAFPGITEGEAWYQGDHSILAMNDVPAIAIASAGMYEFMAGYAHSERDTPELADHRKIEDIAVCVRAIIASIAESTPPRAGS